MTPPMAASQLRIASRRSQLAMVQTHWVRDELAKAHDGLEITIEAMATQGDKILDVALAKIGAEYILRWLPAGTHDWNKFLKPEELQAFLASEPVQIEGPFGVSFNPLSGKWVRSGDSDVNYMMTVLKPALV